MNTMNTMKAMGTLLTSLPRLLVAVLTATALTGCSEDIYVDDTPQGGGTGTQSAHRTVFSSGPAANHSPVNGRNRTSMDASRNFYWEPGDKIWVNHNGSWVQSLPGDISSGKTPRAEFVLEAALGNPEYDVLYTGVSPSADRVTIAAAQRQLTWDDASHLGESGDCGTDVARGGNGSYTFELKHKASYLVFQPYKPDNITYGWQLLSVDIVDAEGKTLCGTYPFGTGGLDVSSATQTGDSIRLTCGTAGFPLPSSTAWEQEKSSLFAVIQPGTHKLRIRYTIKPSAGASFTIVKEIGEREYRVNGVTTIKHKLNNVFGYYGTANCLLLANDATSGELNVAPYRTDNTFIYTTDYDVDAPKAASARLIWEEVRGLIGDLSISGEGPAQKLTVTRRTGTYGNALVGIYDAGGDLLWSFHVWMPQDNPTDLLYTQMPVAGRTYNVLSMPIGATKYATASSPTADKLNASGLWYQWGRKDPLGRNQASASPGIRYVYNAAGGYMALTSAAYIRDVTQVLPNNYNEATHGPKSHYMVRYSIKNPTVFITSGSDNNDWAGETNNHLWGNTHATGTFPSMSQTYKSIFDPSPAGYRVAPEEIYWNFTTTHGPVNTADQINGIKYALGYGFYYQGTKTGPTHFYASCAYRIVNTGTLGGAEALDGASDYWSSTPNGVRGIHFDINPNYAVNPFGQYGLRANGLTVMCVKEE